MLPPKTKSLSPSDLFKRGYPSQFKKSKQRSIIQFSDSPNNSPPQPSHISDNTSRASFQTMSQEQFNSMLEIPEPKVNEPSMLGRSLYELSVNLRSLGDILNQLLDFRINAPLSLYSYSALIDLINASGKCPPDSALYILLIAKDMVLLGNYARPIYLKKLIKITQHFIKQKYYYFSFADDQLKAERKLQKILKVLQGEITTGRKKRVKHEGTLNTWKIEMMMQKDQKQNNERLQKEIERRRLGLKKPEELKIKKVEEPIEEEEEEENHENKTSHLQTKSYPQNSDIEKENVHEKVNSDFNIDENEIEEEEQFEEEEAQIKNIDKSDTENPEKERNKKNSQMDNQKIDGNLQNKHFSKSIDNLLRSTDSLNERREKGSVLYKNLSPSQIQLFSRLAKLFKSMDTIYDACQIVWNIMKNDSNFEINILLSQIQTSYGDFLIEALISFADSDGIIIPEIVSPK